MPAVIVFTDLDGTLLHPETYSFREAAPALALIRERGIPLVLCSSKTRAELLAWRDRLGDSHPFIAENGGGIFIPAGYFPFPIEGEQQGCFVVHSLGASYPVLRSEFVRLREHLHTAVRGFGDMTIPEIAALTGLKREDAALARQREFDEPFVFDDEDTETREEFLKAIGAGGFSWTRGAFYHMLGRSDKGRAVIILKEYYQKMLGSIVTIGVGDGMNDLPLLRAVDQAVLVQKRDGSYEQGLSLPGLVKADGIGPVGWNKVVRKLLGA